MSLELILKSANIDLPNEIENLEQLKTELIPRLEKYNSLVVTEDSIKAAKEDKANLNKLRKAIEEQRISIKKQYLEPYNVLEAQCKEVVALIDAPIQAIDKQIKAFDEVEKLDKRMKLEDAFKELNAPEWVQLEDVLNPKWENKTAKLDALKAEMAECYKKMIADLDKLMEMYKDFPHKLAIEQKYKACKDFSKAAIYAVQLETEWKKEQERKAKEEERKAAEEAKAVESVQNAPETPATDTRETIPAEQQGGIKSESEQPVKMFRGKFEVECTKEQLIALGNFMRANGIKFKTVKE